MPHRTVGELMTAPGIRVHRGTTAGDVTRLLDEHSITAVPVVDDGECPVGVVSRKDLGEGSRRVRTSGEAGPYSAYSAARSAPAGPGRRLSGVTTADDVMTSPAVTARPGWSLAQAARTMERRRVKRLPVVDGADRLVGFLGRTDLVRSFVRPDRAVRQEIAGDVLDRTLGIGPRQVTVTVAEGRVTLQGIVEHRSLLPVVDRLTRGVDGVVEVRNHLAYLTDAPPDAAPRAGLR
ncbi:CBS domain-containing protein [Streptomyces winkii]|uniref:CBS domain-containing protein n=1 Tax=Streptomyces winkii TaxID=3051178 RepID=UPI0028D6E63E|nr:CBS domain-containing protein [Streptomyces sp. DSM 40971]